MNVLIVSQNGYACTCTTPPSRLGDDERERLEDVVGAEPRVRGAAHVQRRLEAVGASAACCSRRRRRPRGRRRARSPRSGSAGRRPAPPRAAAGCPSSSLRPSAREPVPAARDHLPAVVHVDLAPAHEAAGDLVVGLRVGGLEGRRASRRRTRRRSRTCRPARCARARRPRAPGPAASTGSRGTARPGRRPRSRSALTRLYGRGAISFAPAMARPVTLFTGQWADLPLTELAEKAGGWGFDGLELACWGDHFDVDAALADDALLPQRKHELLDRHDLSVWAIGNHLVGQAVCDPHRRPPPGRAPARRLGRRRPRGRPAARRRQAQGHRARRRAARRRRPSPASPARRSGTCSTASRPTTSRRSSAATSSSPSASTRSSTSSTPRA